MDRFVQLDAIGCPLALESVDTDQLIPARYMSRPRAEGYGGFLLHDLRFDPDARNAAAAALDDPRYIGAAVLVGRRNFGCGSSREAAVYALWDYGFRCVIAPSFGDIFAINAVKNGLLPAQVDAADAEALLARLADAVAVRISVDLMTQTIRMGDLVVRFEIDAVARQKLLNGWDDLSLTMQHAEAIAAFKRGHATEQIGAWPRRFQDVP